MWIRLKSIQTYAYHGVHAHEQEHGGRFEIDLEVRISADEASATDDLQETVDYVALQKLAIRIATTERFRLIETLADAIATATLASFDVLEVIVRVRKPGAATGVVLETVEVETHRHRAE